MLRYRRLNSCFYTDTLFATAKAKSSCGNKCAQLFVSDKGFVAVYPMKHERDYLSALRQFAKDVGVPLSIIADGAAAQGNGPRGSRAVKDFCNQIGTTLRQIETMTSWANRAELYVGLIKEAVRKDTREQHSPLVLWDYCLERRALIYQVTAKNLFQLGGTTPYTATFGEQADISNICQFGWYEWVYFRDKTADYPHMQEVLGRCLGPAKNEGNSMAQWVLKMNGEVVPRR